MELTAENYIEKQNKLIENFTEIFSLHFIHVLNRLFAWACISGKFNYVADCMNSLSHILYRLDQLKSFGVCWTMYKKGDGFELDAQELFDTIAEEAGK